MSLKACAQWLWTLLKEEDGDTALETAILLPAFFILFGFMQNSFLHYEGLNAVTLAANEAMRYAITAESEELAQQRVIETLTDRLKTTNMGWCAGDACTWWSADTLASDEAAFENSDDQKLLLVTDKGWCDGSTITLGVRAHKSSLFPDFKSFRNAVLGKPIYQTFTYTISARVEGRAKCS